ncbi:Zinc finger FYVE domain-containing protein 1 [Portunus trituberculatus]|uniref:Zinc finger FYVE domain-containing protein 1 n=1 Tax=Portunus trituberculatus TaxID=210409 RepID=A0A5B7EGQ5_PORTR|nr:Zinc finger FYVE domain-containing protein 1 [Portunus trituberculatus]
MTHTTSLALPEEYCRPRSLQGRAASLSDATCRQWQPGAVVRGRLSIPSSSGPAIMSSLASDSPCDTYFNSMASQQSSMAPDILNTQEMRSVDLEPVEKKCFKLINEKEELQVKNAKELLSKMGCSSDKNLYIKVVSIFGNTGEGKSYTLNEIFFNGAEVFKTSANQSSCTLGVWGAYDPFTKALVLDTEGMLGISNSSKQRKRLLLKVLAISDIIIYRTRAERLNTDMYKFLAEASRAYTKYFRGDLEAVARKAECDCIFGPPVYIFHDTRHTNVLTEEMGQKPEEQLKENFTKQDLKIDGFNSIHYIGERNNGRDTDFKRIKKVVFEELDNINVRSPRQPKIILDMLDVLEGMAALGSAISTISTPPAKVVSAWLTNQVNPTYWKPNHLCTHCKICQVGLDTIHHCRKCGDGFCDPCSDDKMPVPELGWGEEPVRVCKNCYKARNSETGQVEDYEWSSDAQTVRARQVTEVISGTLATVAKYPLDFLKDSARPSYWVPDDMISECVVCSAEFGPRLPLHHCRACGQGVCSSCSPNLRAVKERGWDHPHCTIPGEPLPQPVATTCLCYCRTPVQAPSQESDTLMFQFTLVVVPSSCPIKVPPSASSPVPAIRTVSPVAVLPHSIAVIPVAIAVPVPVPVPVMSPLSLSAVPQKAVLSVSAVVSVTILVSVPILISVPVLVSVSVIIISVSVFILVLSPFSVPGRLNTVFLLLLVLLAVRVFLKQNCILYVRLAFWNISFHVSDYKQLLDEENQLINLETKWKGHSFPNTDHLCAEVLPDCLQHQGQLAGERSPPEQAVVAQASCLLSSWAPCTPLHGPPG